MKIPFWQFGLIAALIIILTFISGCTEKEVTGPEIVSEFPAELGEQSYPITLDEGVQLMNSLFSKVLTYQDGSLPIYYILGRGVTQEGKAEQWIFGTEAFNDTYFVFVESDNQEMVPVQMDLPIKNINTKGIITVGTLIAKNAQIILETYGQDGDIPLLQIELKGNTYSVCPSSINVTKILFFEASSGTLVSP